MGRIARRPGPASAGLLVAVAVFALGAAGAVAQSFPRMLEEVKVYAGEGGEQLALRFSTPYQGTPDQEHRPGGFRLHFNATGSTEPVRNLRVSRGGVIEDIQVVQNQYSTTVAVQLRRDDLSLEGRLDFARDGNVLTVALPDPAAVGDTAGTSAADDAGTKAPAAQMQGEAPDRPGTELGGFRAMDWMPALVTMVAALAVIIGGLYGMLYLYNRFFANRLGRISGGQHSIRQVASFHIGPKQRIVVLDINGEVIACGVTPTQITPIAKLSGKSGAARRPSQGGAGSTGTGGTPPAEGASRAAAESVEAQAPRRAESAAAPEPGAHAADPVQQFAETLRHKVRSLKRLD